MGLQATPDRCTTSILQVRRGLVKRESTHPPCMGPSPHAVFCPRLVNPSLSHTHSGGQPTPYEEAITGVARVLEAYDTDKIFQTFLFGGKHPLRGGIVEHCAPLPSNGDPSCAGISGILQAYR
jgi:hypothetical protein